MNDDKAKDPASLVLFGQEGHTEAEVRAAATIEPAVQAAYTVAKIEKGGDLNALVDALQTQSRRATSGDTGRMEEMLVTQAHTLDLIFNNLTRRAVANMQEGYVPVAETYLRLALKAQSQCRASIERPGADKESPRGVCPSGELRQRTTASQQWRNSVTPAEKRNPAEQTIRTRA